MSRNRLTLWKAMCLSCQLLWSQCSGEFCKINNERNNKIFKFTIQRKYTSMQPCSIQRISSHDTNLLHKLLNSGFEVLRFQQQHVNQEITQTSVFIDIPQSLIPTEIHGLLLRRSERKYLTQLLNTYSAYIYQQNLSSVTVKHALLKHFI